MADKKKVHPTRSFDQIMANSQLKALEPYINQQVNSAGRQILMQLSELLLNHLAEVKLRSFAVESILKEKLNLAEDDISERISAEEDKMFGYVEVAGPAQEGDLIRLDMTSTLGPKSKRQPLAGKVLIKALMQKTPTGSVQTIEEVEQAMVGMSKGESRTLLLDTKLQVAGEEPVDNDESATYSWTVKRVSRKV